jgi:hypoxanthine phosphoribosyltransferase
MPDQNPLYQEVFAAEAEVRARIDEMAALLVEKFKDQNPLFVCLMQGGAPFATQLMFAITEHDPDFHPQMDYLIVSSYGDELVGRQPHIVTDLAPTTLVTDRPVVVLDDVLDKGHTAAFTEAHLLNKGARSVDLVVLAVKDVERTAYGRPLLHGFETPDEWLVGMGMDDPRIAQNALRWAGFIAIGNPPEEVS